MHIVTPVRVYTEKNAKLHIVTPMRVYTENHSFSCLFLASEFPVFGGSHQQLPMVTSVTGIHGKPSKIAHSDARESRHGKL